VEGGGWRVEGGRWRVEGGGRLSMLKHKKNNCLGITQWSQPVLTEHQNEKAEKRREKGGEEEREKI
jgi:hypothetical protein